MDVLSSIINKTPNDPSNHQGLHVTISYEWHISSKIEISFFFSSVTQTLYKTLCVCVQLAVVT